MMHMLVLKTPRYGHGDNDGNYDDDDDDDDDSNLFSP